MNDVADAYALSMLSMRRLPPSSTLFPYTTLFRSWTIGLSASTTSLDLPDAQVSSVCDPISPDDTEDTRSEEHTSELQSHSDLVCRLLLEKKKTTSYSPTPLPSVNKLRETSTHPFA